MKTKATKRARKQVKSRKSLWGKIADAKNTREKIAVVRLGYKPTPEVIAVDRMLYAMRQRDHSRTHEEREQNLAHFLYEREHVAALLLQCVEKCDFKALGAVAAYLKSPHTDDDNKETVRIIRAIVWNDHAQRTPPPEGGQWHMAGTATVSKSGHIVRETPLERTLKNQLRKMGIPVAKIPAGRPPRGRAAKSAK